MDNFLLRTRRGRAGWPGTGRQEVFDKYLIFKAPDFRGLLLCSAAGELFVP